MLLWQLIRRAWDCRYRSLYGAGVSFTCLVVLQGGVDAQTGTAGVSGQMAVGIDGDLSAGAAIQKYYEAVSVHNERRLSLIDNFAESFPSCTGLSLHDCFGGDLYCAWMGTRCSPGMLVQERILLLKALDSLMELYPRSERPVGYLVNMALSYGDTERARMAVERCDSLSWWCQALRGYVAHYVGAPADAHFDSALAFAPPGTPAYQDLPDPLLPDRGLECEWRDVEPFLSGAGSKAYAVEPCGIEPEMESRFWWLADPLWADRGNTRRSEHIVRHIRIRLLYMTGRDVRNGRNIPFTWTGSPQYSSRAWIRNGFFNSWRTVTRLVGGAPVMRTELYVNGGYRFAPGPNALLDPMASVAEDWDVGAVELERMITREAWYNLDFQSVVLRRGARLQVYVAAKPPFIPTSYDDVEASLVLGRITDQYLVPSTGAVDSSGVLRAGGEVDDGQWLQSVEVVGPGWHARARSAAPAPMLTDGFGVSDPVLTHEQANDIGENLLGAMLGSANIGGRTRVGVYFELYGLAVREVVSVRISVQPVRRSLLRRIGSAFGIAPRGPVSLAYDALAEELQGDVLHQEFSLGLGQLEGGAYELTLRVERRDGARAHSVRRFIVE